MHPDKVGPYLIDRKIGAGGMGNVYHGVHELTQQEAAIKVLPVAMAREDGFVQRFSREIDALRQLSNRHIVQLFQDGETTDGTFYYAMEFVDGHTLTAEITNRKKLPWKDVIEYSMQIAAALKAAHDAGIVHRDLKPSNLMLTNDRVIKLTDFGVASLFASARLTRTGGVVGTGAAPVGTGAASIFPIILSIFFCSSMRLRLRTSLMLSCCSAVGFSGVSPAGSSDR